MLLLAIAYQEVGGASARGPRRHGGGRGRGRGKGGWAWGGGNQVVSPSTQCGLVKVAAGGGGSTGSCFREEECGQECSTVTSTQCTTTTQTQCQVQHVMKCNTQRRL